MGRRHRHAPAPDDALLLARPGRSPPGAHLRAHVTRPPPARSALPRRGPRRAADVLGGPPTYSSELGGTKGGHARMVSHHLGRMLTEQQRYRWVQLLLACADEISLP